MEQEGSRGWERNSSPSQGPLRAAAVEMEE